MASLNVDVVTPSRLVIKTQASEVTLPGVLGEFGILPQHTPFLTILGIGTLTVKKAGEKTSKYAINGGFAEISEDHMIILTETCEAADEIDLNRARKARDESEKALLELDSNTLEYRQHWERAKRAAARIEVREASDLL